MELLKKSIYASAISLTIFSVTILTGCDSKNDNDAVMEKQTTTYGSQYDAQPNDQQVSQSEADKYAQDQESAMRAQEFLDNMNAEAEAERARSDREMMAQEERDRREMELYKEQQAIMASHYSAPEYRP